MSEDLDVSVSIRLDATLRAAVDATRRELARATPGVLVSRSDAVRVLLHRAIGAAAEPVRHAEAR